MSFNSWLQQLRSLFTLARGKPKRSQRRQFLRPSPERLEDRLAPALFTVNSLADTSVIDGSNRSGLLTLRDAILVEDGALAIVNLSLSEQAQISGTLNATGGDTIQFAPALAGQTMNLTAFDDTSFGNSAFLVNSQLTIQGAGITIARDTHAADYPNGQLLAYRLFNVASNGNLALQNATLENGDAVNRSGGGIYNAGTLTLTNVTLSGNAATHSGGAIADNAGTATLTDITLSSNTANSADGIDDNGGTVTLDGQGWSNSETIAASNFATLDLYGSWTNTGTINVDATSTICLGSVIAVDPTSGAAAGYNWTNTGSITIANGATVNLGGIVTTDEYASSFQSLGVNMNLSEDAVSLTGTIDNRAADNPVSGGVLALGVSTGPLYLVGGEIYQGAVTTTGADDLVAAPYSDNNDGITTSGGGTLDGVTLDGTLDMTESNSTATVLGGLVLDGTIELGGSLNFGSNGDNTPQTISGTGTIQFTGSGADTLENNSNDTLTIGPNITIQGAGAISGAGPIDFQGTIDVTGSGAQLTVNVPGWTNQGTMTVSNGATLTVVNGATPGYRAEYLPTDAPGWTNEGTMTASNGATLNLYLTWTNSGTISVDGTSTISLGNEAPAIDPTSSAAAPYIWTNSGTIAIASGATVNLGGVFTTDELNTLVQQQTLSQDTVNLIGILDNSPADNPISHGVLALSTMTGSLTLNLEAGYLYSNNGLYNTGEIYQGTITTSGTDGLVYNSVYGFTLDGVTLDGTLEFDNGSGLGVVGGLVLNGTIALGGGSLGFGSNGQGTPQSIDNPPESITGTGTIMGPGNLYNGNDTLTIGPNITIQDAGSISGNGPIDFQGTIDDTASGEQLSINAPGWTNQGTITVANGATLNLSGSWTNSGTISVDGTSTISLGSPIAVDPTSSAAAQYIWTNTGTITIANGATVNLGGVLTTDDFNSIVQQQGLSQDTVSLIGTLDNSPADNPVSHGVLALSTMTGSLTLNPQGFYQYPHGYTNAGEIYQGTITTSDTDDLVVSPANGDFTLDGVTLDGTLDMANGSGLAVVGGLVLDGAIENATTLNFGTNDDNTPQSITGTGTIQVGPNDNGTSLVNNSNDTLTIGPNITIQDAIANTSINISGAGPMDLQGTITVANGATLSLSGRWTNWGTISVDGTSTIDLGAQVKINPTSSGAAQYLWTNTGTIAIASGATVNLGGVFTTDDFNSIVHQQSLSQDTVTLIGTIDNSVADNPISGGVLALDAATGPLTVNNGEIYQGTITTTGTDDLVAGDNSGGTLDGVTLDGTLDMTEYLSVSMTILEGLVVNGTIEMGGYGQYAAFLYFGDGADTPQTISGTGAIQLGQVVYSSYLYNANNATLTFGPNITIQGGGGNWDVTQSISDFSSSGPIDFQGTINVSVGGGSLTINVPYWTNEGAMTVTNGAGLNLYGSWSNSGTITVEDNSTIGLGSSVAVDPTSSAAAQYVWTNSGTITIANGTTVNLGGVLTTDSFHRLVQVQSLSQYTFNFSGTIDNSVADNPISGGVLALDASTGPLYLSGGEIYQGTITTSGADNLVGGGTLDGVTLDGALDMTVPGGSPSTTVLDGLVLNGTIDLGTTSNLSFGSGGDNTPQTLSGSGAIQFEGYSGAIVNNSNDTLTIGPNITIQAGDDTQLGGAIDNEGTINENTGGDTLAIAGAFTNSGTVAIGSHNGLATYGGSYTQSAGTTTIDGTVQGSISVSGGLLDGNGVIQGDLINAGTVNAGDGAGTLTVTGDYTQTAAGALDISLSGGGLLGQLAVGGEATLDGTLNLSLLNGFLPGATDQFDVLTFNQVAGAFAALTGLGPYSNGVTLVAAYTNSLLALVGTPPSVDLTLVTASAPASAYLNDVIPVAWTVENVGASPANQHWQDGVYLSNADTLTPSAQLLATFAAPPSSPLASDGSYSLDEDVRIPSGASTGPQFLLFVTDVNGAQLVTNGAGADAVDAVPISLSAPQLAVANVSAPASALFGENVSVSWQVTNTSSLPLDQNWSDDVYLSSSSQFDSSATLLEKVPALGFLPLAAGASYTQNITLAAPLSASSSNGTYYLYVVADGQDQVPIADRTPTVDSTSINLKLPPLPDLVAAGISAPANALTGQSVTVNWTDQNQGTAAATGPWTDDVYLATDAQGDNPTLLTTYTFTGTLAAGATAQASTAIPMPQTPGNYWVVVTTNANGGVAEGPFAGNDTTVASFPIDVAQGPLPDLTVNGVSGPANGVTGQNVVVSWTDQNQGAAAASGWTDNVYLATDAQGDNQTLLGSFAFPGSLAAGASAELTQQVTLPETVGTFWFVVTTNIENTVYEGPSPANPTSVAASSIDITQAPLPDLVVASITPPTNGVLSGTSVPITFVVKNQGNAPTSAPVWQDWVILSQDPNLGQSYNGSNDQLLNNQPIILGFDNPSYLDPGQSYSQTVYVTLPITAQGTWYVYVVPDGTGHHHPFAMLEASRTDKLQMSAGFTIALSPPPVLDVTAVQALPPNFSGLKTTVTWTVANTGAGPTEGNYNDGLVSYSVWTDAVYMSQDPTLDANAVLLGQFNHEGTLPAGTSYTNSQYVTLPQGVSGPFYFLVQTDTYGQIFQNGNTADNVGVTAAPVTVSLFPPPELEVTSVTAPNAALAGHELTFNYQVTNGGAGATDYQTRYWTDAYYLSPTPTYDAYTAIALGSQTIPQDIDPGQTASYTVSEPVPNGLSGIYYLIVNTDSTAALFELDRSLGFGSSAGSIAVSSKPADLVVSAASAPATGPAGGAVLVNWSVTNQGAGDTAVTSWQDNVYADTGSSLTSNGILLGSFTHNGLLDAGASYDQSQLVNLPISLSGPYNLFVVTNETDQPQVPSPNPPVYESNFNNDISAPVPITIDQNLADLTVSSVTAPIAATTGSSVTVSWTVQNIGTGATNAYYWYDDVWLSTSSTLDSGGSDVYLGTVQHSNLLAAGDSYDATANVTLPADLAAGNYYFIVATDRPVALPANDTNTAGEGVELVDENNYNNNETASATSVSLAPTPELSVSGVTAPATATSGGQFQVSWTVTNNGAPTSAYITDSVYLSYAPDFDPAHYLGSLSYYQALATGGSYTENPIFTLPVGLAGTYYVFVQTDSDNSIYERNTANNAADDPTPVQISLPPPADLVAGTVTVPVNAVVGQNITITYQVTNDSHNVADGSWNDSLYLSPTPTWTINDPLLGTVAQTQDLAANGGGYTGTLTTPLPGVVPGDYYVIVRSNILDTLPEATLANNLSASLTQTSIDVAALTLGTPATGGFEYQGEAAYYKVVVAAGQTLKVNFTSGYSGLDDNDLFVSYGTMPTRGQYDYRYSLASSNTQQITVPTTQAGTYYILAYASDVYVYLNDVADNYSLTASLVPFSITAASPGQVGTGVDTFEIQGSRFTNTTTFQLLGPNSTLVNDQMVYPQDGSTAYATFDLTGMPTGTYTMQATQSDGSTTELAGAAAVVPAVASDLQLSFSSASGVLAGRPGVVTINYKNAGNTDIPAPLLTLSSTDALLELPANSYQASSVQILGISYQGPAGILLAGYQGSISISFDPTTTAVGASVNFTLQQVAPSTASPDWSELLGSKPATVPTAAWNAIIGNFMAVLDTQSQYITALDNDATYLSEVEEYVADPAVLLFYELNKAADEILSLPLGTTTDAGLPTPGQVPLEFQQSFAPGISSRYTLGALGYGWTYTGDESLSTDSQGDVTILDNDDPISFQLQSNGTYLSPPGFGATITVSGGEYILTDPSGITAFTQNGYFDYTQDLYGNRVTAAHDNAGQMISLTASNGSSLAFTYNSHGTISAITDSTGRVVNFTYDATGTFLSSVSGPNGATQYTYVTGQGPAADNALASITNPDGSHDYFTYDSQGRLIGQSEDDNIDAATYSYGSAGGITVTNAVGSSTTYLYNVNGQVGEVLAPLNEVTQYFYDSNQNLVKILQPDGDINTYTYDVNGNVASETDPLGNTVSFTYSSANLLTSFEDAAGNTTNYGYNADGSLLSITYPNATTEQFSYDPLGNLISATDQDGQTVADVYNNNGQVVRETFADGSQTDLTYDAHGNLTTYTDGAGTTTLQYSTADLLTKITYPSGMYLVLSYDAAGRRISAEDQTGYVINYGYDAVGRLSELTDGNGNLIVAYTYDAAGELIQKDLGNGTRTVYTYDAAGDVQSIVNLAPDHVTVNSYDDYTYDTMGGVLTDTSQNGVWTYTYDADERLVAAVFVSSNPAVLPNQNLQYAYDANGNRLSQTVNGVQTSYVVNDMNEDVSATTAGVGTTTYQYDNDGDLISRSDSTGTTAYSYNQLNQLLSITGPDSNTTTYQYDLFGNISSATVNGVATQSVYDPNGGLFAQYDGSGNLIAHYTFGLGLTSQVSAGGSAYYYDFNNIGSVVGLTNSTGSYVDQYAYAPFGGAATLSSSVANVFTFAGQTAAISAQNGLYKMGVRFYDSASGQFLSADPLGLASGQADFRIYVNDDPTNLIDPSGFCSISFGPQGGFWVGGGLYVTINSSGDVFLTLSGGATTPGVTIVNISMGDASEGVSITVSGTTGSYPAGAGASVTTNVTTTDVFEIIDNGYGTQISVNYKKFHFSVPEIDGNASFGAAVTGGSAMGQLTVKLPQYHVNVPPWLDKVCNPKVKDIPDILYWFLGIISPKDPNNLIGPDGFGTAGFVGVDEALPYTIDFENEPTATAPAQQVVITQQLDPNLNWGSFRLGSFGFGGQTYQVPANSSFYFTQIDLTRQDGYDVDVTASIDELTGMATWIFTTIDPATGQIPVDPTIGFLPPDVNSSGIGAGFVSYTVTASPTDTTGTVINAQATVDFYTQPPINTPQIFNTIDTGAGLTSSIASLPTSESSPTFTVSWSGADDSTGSAISGFTIYVSDNGAAFTPWLANTTLTSASYVGQIGQTYGFYSVVSDNAGNVQPTPTAAQATTSVRTSAIITWANPSDISYGTALGLTQLDAAASAVVNGSTVPLPGTFIYTLADDMTPAAGLILQAGQDQVLNVSFTPTNAVDFATATSQVRINIDPKALTVSIIGDPTKTYDGTTAATLTSANFQLSGLVGTDRFTVTQTAGDYNNKDTNANTVSAPLSASDFSVGTGTLAGDYTLPTSASGAGAITAASQSILFSPNSPVPYGTPITLSAGGGGGSGNSVTFSVISGPATLSGNTLTFTDIGSVVVEAEQAGNADYTAAPPVRQTIVVTTISPILKSENENGTPTAVTVSNLLTGHYFDPDGNANTKLGIAAFQINGNGIWQYSTNGATWIAINSVSPTQALLLPGSDSLRFVPATNWSGQANLSFVAWDGSQGKAGSLANTIPGGGTTAFSTSAGELALTVSPTPIWVGAGAHLTSTPPGTYSATGVTPAGNTIASVFGGYFHDDNAAVTVGVAIVSVTGVSSGVWQYLPGSTGAAWTTFPTVSTTSALLLAATDQVRFVPNKNFTGIVSLSALAWDSSVGTADHSGSPVKLGSAAFSTTTLTATGTIMPAIAAANHAPILSTPASNGVPVAVNATGAAVTVSSLMTEAGYNDPDGKKLPQGIAIIGTYSAVGAFQYMLSGETWQPLLSPSSSAALLLPSNALLRFVAGSQLGTATLTFEGWDETQGAVGEVTVIAGTGGANAFSTASSTLSIAVQEAPAWSASSGPSLPSLAPGVYNTTPPAGSTVATVFGSFFEDANPNVTVAIAVVGLTGNGTWQYSTDDASWSNFTLTPSNSAAALLSGSDQVRFVPKNNTATTATLKAYAWDGTGDFSRTANLTKTGIGAATPFSATTLTANCVVNTAPSLETQAIALSAIKENAIGPALTATSLLKDAKYTDPDGKTVPSGIAITGDTGPGIWQYLNGSAWTALPVVSSTSAFLLPSTASVRIDPADNLATNTNGSATLTYLAWDQTAGAADTTYAVTNQGGTSAFSTQSTTVSLPVNFVKQAPFWAVGGSAAFTPVLGLSTSNPNPNPAGDTIASIFGNAFTDAAGIQVHVAITAQINDSAGVWQIFTNSQWISLPAVSMTSALLLSGSDMLRFLPNKNFSGKVTLTAYAWDGTGNFNGTANLTKTGTGGTSPFSATSLTATCLVNTAPTLT